VEGCHRRDRYQGRMNRIRERPRRCADHCVSGAMHHASGSENIREASPQTHADRGRRLSSRPPPRARPTRRKSMRKKFASWARKAYCCARSSPLPARKRRVLAFPVLKRRLVEVYLAEYDARILLTSHPVMRALVGRRLARLQRVVIGRGSIRAPWGTLPCGVAGLLPH
jgi:hypothetical protein